MNLLQQFSVRRARRQGNEISYQGAILESVSFELHGTSNRISIGAGTHLFGVRFLIWGNNHNIEIGESCRIGQHSEIWIEDSGCALSIGKGSTFQNNVHLALTEDGSRIDIGRDCMFSYNIDVRTGDSHSILDLHSRARINYAKNVHIGDHVWVGPHSSILKGSVVSEGSVVATRSVVTSRFVEPHVVVGGSPARILRREIEWLRERL